MTLANLTTRKYVEDRVQGRPAVINSSTGRYIFTGSMFTARLVAARLASGQARPEDYEWHGGFEQVNDRLTGTEACS